MSSIQSLNYGRKRKREEEQDLMQIDGMSIVTDTTYKLPEWFFESCVHTVEELQTRQIPLILRSDNEDADTSSTPLKTGYYEVNSALYQPLLNEALPTICHSMTDGAKAFLHDAVHLLYPEGLDGQGSRQFWTAIVEYFARQIRADLVTLDADTLIDLQSYCKVFSEDANYLKKAIVNALLTSPNTKQSRTRSPFVRATIIHLPEFHRMLSLHNSFASELNAALKLSNKNVFCISTTSQPSRPDALEAGNLITKLCSCEPCQIRITSIGTNVRRQAILLAPVCNTAQKALLIEHRKLEESFEQENIRFLKRSIRESRERYLEMELLEPFTEWHFLQRPAARQLFAQKKLTSDDLGEFLWVADRNLDEDELEREILSIASRNAILDTWRVIDRVGKSISSRWSSFPTEVQSKIQTIQKDADKLTWENYFIDFLVNPEDAGEEWSNIAIDPEIKNLTTRSIPQPSTSGRSAYGILRRERVGGALLYGPPGTGKTHLARVLARESKIVMICVSAANLCHSYVGDSEKAIQGLFNLGRKLAPAIIFIDEADALFRTRQLNDRSWERNATNQLLSEMDGVQKDAGQAFVLLATNCPQDLDTAVLRRVPSRIYIGLPDMNRRIEIFRICLRDESIDPAVNFKILAEKTTGFSGSDIQTLCVQSALICNESIESGKDRILKQPDFDKALSRSSPTVSKKALDEIKAFAKAYDPRALEEMKQEGKFKGARDRPIITTPADTHDHIAKISRKPLLVSGSTIEGRLMTGLGSSIDESNQAQETSKFQYKPL